MVQSAAFAYRDSRADKLQQHVQSHLPLVYSVAQRFARISPLGTLEVSDLVNAGVLGLYKAAEKFDEQNGNTFASYAAPYIRGAILDELNQHHQLPRSIRDRSKKVKKAQAVLSQKFSREPIDDEVANYLGISVDTYGHWLMDLGFTSICSVDELESVGELPVQDESIDVSPEKTVDEKEFKAELAGALGELAEREQQVLYLYYQEELTLKEIAYILNLSESQISRIHSKTILRLRRMLQDGA
jgi:RNA polymerase sigma factor FliA